MKKMLSFALLMLLVLISISFIAIDKNFEVKEKFSCYCISVDREFPNGKTDFFRTQVCGAKDQYDAIRIKREELEKIYSGTGIKIKAVYMVADMYCR